MKDWSEEGIIFLVKDPHWTFLWWDRSASEAWVASRRSEWNAHEPRLCLRIHDVTDILFDGQNSHSFFDVDVVGDTDHWYLRVPVAGRNYCAELGYKVKDRFMMVARSNSISLPKDGPVRVV
jgi:hypothetical protein